MKLFLAVECRRQVARSGIVPIRFLMLVKLALVCGLWACAGGGRTLTAEEVAARSQVLATVLEDISRRAETDSVLVLSDTISPGVDILPSSHSQYGLWKTLDSYELRRVTLGKHTCHVTFISGSDLEKLRTTEDGMWGALHRAFPLVDGLISFSEVAFDADGQSSLVYAAFRRGVESGFSGVFQLERFGAGWRITDILVTRQV